MYHNISGTVKIGFTIKENGKTTDVTVLKSTNPLLDRKAKYMIKAIDGFIPAMKGGLYVPTKMSLNIRFRLDGKYKESKEPVDFTPIYNSVLFYDSAYAHLEKRNYPQAIKFYTESLKWDTADYWSYYERGVAHYALQNIDSAEHDFRMALQHSGGWFVRAFLTRGHMRFEFGNVDSAITDFLNVLDSYNENYSVHLALGKCWLKKNDLKEARKYFRLATSIGPKFTDAFYYLGIVYITMQKFEDAKPCFDRVIELNPEHDKAFYNRGMAHARLRNMDAACLDWIKAKSLGNEDANLIVQSQCLKPITE